MSCPKGRLSCRQNVQQDIDEKSDMPTEKEVILLADKKSSKPQGIASRERIFGGDNTFHDVSAT